MTARQLLAALGLLGGLFAGGVLILPDESTPVGTHVLDPPVGAMKDFWVPVGGPQICGGLDCDAPVTGLETSLCELRGPGVVRQADGTLEVEGLFYEAVILPGSGTNCLLHMRQTREQEVLAANLEPTDAIFDDWAHIKNASNNHAALNPSNGALADTHSFYGQTKDDTDALVVAN